MTQSHDEMIAVIQAHKDGAVIQYRNLGWDDWWCDCRDDPEWAFSRTEYRVKPAEPKLVPHWPAVFVRDGGHYVSGRIFATADAARCHFGNELLRLVTEHPPIMLPEMQK